MGRHNGQAIELTVYDKLLFVQAIRPQLKITAVGDWPIGRYVVQQIQHPPFSPVMVVGIIQMWIQIMFVRHQGNSAVAQCHSSGKGRRRETTGGSAQQFHPQE